MRNPARRSLAAIFAVALVASACSDDDPITATDADADSQLADGAEPDDSPDSSMPDMSDDGHDHDGHDHDTAVEFTGSAVPTIDIEVEADPVGGIDIHVETTNFTVNAAAASTEHVEGEGHYHLWVDGEKVLRFYNNSIHYGGVVEGDVEVMVELSANDHRSYAVGGEGLSDTVEFTVPPHDHSEHSHGGSEAREFAGEPPELSIEVVADPKSGHNAFITLEGMVLSAENASGDHVDGEGHLHLMVNGQKIGRLYGLASHIPVLPEGEVTVSVAAFTNDHQPYTSGGEPVEASTTVMVAS